MASSNYLNLKTLPAKPCCHPSEGWDPEIYTGFPLEFTLDLIEGGNDTLEVLRLRSNLSNSFDIYCIIYICWYRVWMRREILRTKMSRCC